MKCPHSQYRFLFGDGTRVGTGIRVSTECVVCLARGVRSLGPSNDEPEAVSLEIRAAELRSQSVSHWASPPLGFTRDEDFGWYEHEVASHSAHFEKRLAGWLARELATHDGREARDASAWTWDLERPVAPQFEEWVARADRQIEAMDDDAAAQFFDGDVEAMKAYVNGDAGVAIDGLLEDGEAARRAAKERQSALDAARDRPIGAADVFDDEAFDVSDVLPDGEAR